MPGSREIEGVYFKVRADVKEAMDDLARLEQAKARAGQSVGGGSSWGGSGGGWGSSGAANWGSGWRNPATTSFGFGNGSVASPGDYGMNTARGGSFPAGSSWSGGGGAGGGGGGVAASFGGGGGGGGAGAGMGGYGGGYGGGGGGAGGGGGGVIIPPGGGPPGPGALGGGGGGGAGGGGGIVRGGFGRYIGLHVGIGLLTAGGRAALEEDAYIKNQAAAVTPEEQAQVALGAAGNRAKYLSSIPWIGGLAATAHEMWQEFALGDSQRDVVRDEGLAMRGITGQQAINDTRRQLKLDTAGSFDPGSSLSAQVRERTAGRSDTIAGVTKPFNDQILQTQADRRNAIAKMSYGEVAGELNRLGKGQNGFFSPQELRDQLYDATPPNTTAIKAQRDAAGVAAGANVDRQNAYQTGQIGINTQYMGDLTNRGSLTAEYNKAMREATNALNNASAADKQRITVETGYTQTMAQRAYAIGQLQTSSEVSGIGWASVSQTLSASGQGLAAGQVQARGTQSSAWFAYQQALTSNDPERIRIASAGLNAANQGIVNSNVAIQRQIDIAGIGMRGAIGSAEAGLFGGGSYGSRMAEINAGRDIALKNAGNTGASPADINRLADLQGQEASKGRAISMAGLSVQNSYLESQLKAAQQFGHRDFSGAATTTAIGALTQQANAAMVAISSETDPMLRNKMRQNAITGLQAAKETARNQLRSGYAEVEDVYETRASGFRGPQNAMPDTGELVKAITNLIATINTVASRTPGSGDGSGIFFGNGN